MGASQSSTSSREPGGGGRPRTKDGIDVQDYYALLELPDPDTYSSSSEEIRKAYRKLALRFHPDKNPDDVEAANKRFHLIQAAYEVLSDDQERAWYDSHREQILRGGLDEEGLGVDDEEGIDEDLFQSFRSGSKRPPPPPTGSSQPGLTTRQLMRFLDASLCMDTKSASTDESGFFGTFRRLFERIEEEEKGAASYPGDKASKWESMPSFGYSHTPYLHAKGQEIPIHQDQVKDFYSAWSSFSSRKGFGWKDGYRIHDAPDRRTRRLMEKENKRLREEARREYNDVIRSLVSFIRKRDPRFKAHVAAQTGQVNDAEDLERRKLAVERERKEQEERANAFQQQNWDGWNDEHEEDSEYDSDGSFGEQVIGGSRQEGIDLIIGDEEVLETSEMLECFVCDKVFQTEAAFENHEKSNKHRKQIQQIKKQMKMEDIELHQQFDENVTVDAKEPDEEVLSKKARQRLKKRLKEQEKAATLNTDDNLEAETDKAAQSTSSGAIPTREMATFTEDAKADTREAVGNTSKSRRTKREKKTFNAKERCNVCSAGFESRSKLFTHVRENNHYLAPNGTSIKR